VLKYYILPKLFLKMSVSLTFAARKHIAKLACIANKHIQFGCKSGGCAGFEYTWDYISKPPTRGTLPLVGMWTFSVCEKSELFVLGTEVDWVEEGFNAGFVYSNPLATQACGCSLSFHPTIRSERPVR
jgi:iron-sulfur cluster assembly protein